MTDQDPGGTVEHSVAEDFTRVDGGAVDQANGGCAESPESVSGIKEEDNEVFLFTFMKAERTHKFADLCWPLKTSIRHLPHFHRPSSGQRELIEVSGVGLRRHDGSRSFGRR